MKNCYPPLYIYIYIYKEYPRKFEIILKAIILKAAKSSSTNLKSLGVAYYKYSICYM